MNIEIEKKKNKMFQKSLNYFTERRTQFDPNFYKKNEVQK